MRTLTEVAVTTVVAENLYASFLVKFEKRQNIEVTATGQRDVVDNMTWVIPTVKGAGDQKPSLLRLIGQLPLLGFGPADIPAGRYMLPYTPLCGDRYLDTEKPLKITLHLPIGTKIKLHGVYGNMRVEDVEGNIYIENASRCNIRVQNVLGDAVLINKSPANMIVSSVSGNTTVYNCGTGAVYVYGGTTAVFKATLSGGGEILHGGVVQILEAINCGTRNITVDQVSGSHISAGVHSVGNILVLSGTCNHLFAQARNGGGFVFNGSAEVASFILDTTAHIHVDEVTNVRSIIGPAHLVMISDTPQKESVLETEPI